MKGQCAVFLNGVAPEDAVPGVLPLSLSCRPVFYDRPARARAGRPGSFPRPLRLKENLAVLSLTVHEAERDVRGARMDRLLAWAFRGGWLTADARPGKRLSVRLRAFDAGDTLSWTKPVTLTLAAEARPYWEDEEATVASCRGREGRVHMRAPGFATDPAVSVRIRPEGALSSLVVTAGSTTLRLSGDALSAAGTIAITRDEGDALEIRDGAGRPLLSCLAPESDDGLFLPAGLPAMAGFSADVPCAAVFETRGLYL